jgi:hypothetical protein
MYIGSHYGGIHDNYLGSGKRILQAIKKYGKDNFTKEILEIQPSKQLLLERENYWLNKLKCATDSRYYNMTNTAGGGCFLDGKTEKERQKIINESIQRLRKWHNSLSLTNKLKERKKLSKIVKKWWKKMSCEEKKEWCEKRILRQKEIWNNKSIAEKTAITQKRSQGQLKRWKNMSKEEKGLRGKKISQILKAVHKNRTPEQRALIAKRRSKMMIGTKICNDGVKNYRKTLEQIKLLGYKIGKVTQQS